MINTYLYWSCEMFRNYLKIAIRNLQRHRLYSVLNIAGLAVGIACCLLITLWVLDELSFDRFHEHADRLFRVEFDQDYSGQLYHVNVSPHPMGPALTAEIPEVEDASRVNPIGDILVRYGEKTFLEDSVAAVDPSFLKIFSFPLLHGDVRTALDNPHSIIITEEKAKKYFGHVDAIGKTLTLNNQLDFTVTGVMKNIPRTSYLQLDLVFPYEILRVMGWNIEKWTNNSTLTFVLLRETSQPELVAQKIHALVAKHDSGEDQEYSLRPLTQIYLFSYFGFGNKKGNAQYIAIFSAIAVFVLLIACINFMNLSTARAAKRAREVGMRKVVGAVKRQIIQQFYCESCVFVVLSLLLAILLVWLVLPVFNTLSGKDISLYALSTGLAPLALSGILFMTGIIAGSYPALFLSSYHPVKVMKTTIGSGRSSSVFRKVLVVVQFSLSIALIIGTGIVYSQLGFIKEKSLGFDKDHLISIPIRGRDVQDSYNALKKEMFKLTGVIATSASGHKPSGIYSNSDGADWEGKDPEKDVSVYFTSVNYDYFETADMEMVEGRSYSLDFPTDAESAYVVNEELRKLMGANSAVGKQFTFGDKKCTIIGVVKDFHFLSLKKKIEPLVLMLRPDFMNYILIRIRPENIAATLLDIEKTWNKVIPGFPFDYRFINEDFDLLYKAALRKQHMLKRKAADRLLNYNL